jgi:hypothetical protein
MLGPPQTASDLIAVFLDQPLTRPEHNPHRCRFTPIHSLYEKKKINISKKEHKTELNFNRTSLCTLQTLPP